MSDVPSHGGSQTPASAGGPGGRDDEPKTPAWLTALGAALFVALAVAWAASSSGAKPQSAGGPSTSASNAPSVPAAAPSPPTGGGAKH